MTLPPASDGRSRSTRLLRQHEAGPHGPASVVVAVCEALGGGRFVVSLNVASAASRPLAGSRQENELGYPWLQVPQGKAELKVDTQPIDSSLYRARRMCELKVDTQPVVTSVDRHRLEVVIVTRRSRHIGQSDRQQ